MNSLSRSYAFLGVLLGVMVGCARKAPEFPSSSGLAPFRSGPDGSWGYRHRDGSIAITPRYYRAAEFSSDLAAVREKRTGWCAYIDATGRVRLDQQFEQCHPFREGVALVERFGGEVAFIDLAGGNLFTLPAGSVAFDFGDGVAPVRRPGEPGFQYVDRSSRVAIPHRFEQARSFSGGRAPAMRNGRWGFIDRRGEFVIPPVYVEAGIFREGRAPVQVEGSRWWGYLLPDGRWAVEPQPDVTLAGLTVPVASP